jgi:hypothetical protein
VREALALFGIGSRSGTLPFAGDRDVTGSLSGNGPIRLKILAG